MKNFWSDNSILIRNCVILYFLSALCGSVLADSHQNYQQSQQANNADKFSRIISLGIAYQTKQSFTVK